jgi:TatD DNase family protein
MIDSHCHLDDRKYGDRQAEYVRAAAEAGVDTIVNIGVDLPSSQKSVELAEKFEAMYATVGVHPHDAKTLNDEVLAELRRMTGYKKVVAVGEIGLDYYRDLSPRAVQRTVFEKQLQMAVETRMPVVIHTRDAFEDTIDVVRNFASSLVGGVFHCFQETVEDAHQVLGLGFIVSVGGIITFPNSGQSKLAREVPLEKVILETDSPYLTPVPLRGKQNEPANVRFVYEKMAELKGLPLAEVRRQVDRNCKKFYRLEETFGG